jgi:glutamate synthase (NADPH/NADH) small chain
MNLGDYMRFTFMCKREKPPQRLDDRVAVIGAGPTGLAATGYLACKGYQVTVYERLPLPGGMMVFGIPGVRIPKNRVFLGCKELEDIFDVKIVTSCKVHASGYEILGDSFVKEKLELQKAIDEFDATLIATGTWMSTPLPAEGANVEGVYSALEYLFRNRAYELGFISENERFSLGPRVAVVGAGLVAADAAIDAIRDGSQVHLISIEKLPEAPAGAYEIRRLMEQGAKHIERTVIKKVTYRGRIEAVELIKVDAEVKNGLILKLEQIPGTESTIEVDNIIVGIGQRPTPPCKDEVLGIKLSRRGGIEVDERFMTSRQKVFAAGDVVAGSTKVGRAFQSGLKAAYWVDRYLQGVL